jgi:hypothetical protein
MGALVVAVVLYLPDGALSVLKLRWPVGKSGRGDGIAAAIPRTKP